MIIVFFAWKLKPNKDLNRYIPRIQLGLHNWGKPMRPSNGLTLHSKIQHPLQFSYSQSNIWILWLKQPWHLTIGHISSSTPYYSFIYLFTYLFIVFRGKVSASAFPNAGIKGIKGMHHLCLASFIFKQRLHSNCEHFSLLFYV